MAQDPKPKTAGDRRRRRRVSAQGHRQRPQSRQGGRARHRLRPRLSAEHGRFLADHPLGAGGAARSRLSRLLPVRHGRLPARRAGAGARHQDARRRAGGLRGGGGQAAARRGGERRRQYRAVGAGPDDAVSRRHGFHQEIPGAGAGRGGRSARLFPAALRLCRIAGPGPGGRGDQDASTTTSSPTTCTHTTFNTIVGDIAFGPDGEWTEARPIWVQYHDIKGSDIEQFREPKTVSILSPPQYKTGDLIWPYHKGAQRLGKGLRPVRA